jgi:hypothetical protein
MMRQGVAEEGREMVQTHLETVSESPMMVNERRGLVMATKFFFCVSRMIVDIFGWRALMGE